MATGVTSVTLYDASIANLNLSTQPQPNALSHRKQKQPLFGTGTLVAALSAHEGSLLNFVALGHCEMPSLRSKLRQEMAFSASKRSPRETNSKSGAAGGGNRSVSAAAAATAVANSNAVTGTTSAVNGNNNSNSANRTSGGGGAAAVRAKNSAAATGASSPTFQPTSSSSSPQGPRSQTAAPRSPSPLFGNHRNGAGSSAHHQYQRHHPLLSKLKFHPDNNSSDVPLFSTSRGVYVHAQKRGRVALCLPPSQQQLQDESSPPSGGSSRAAYNNNTGTGTSSSTTPTSGANSPSFRQNQQQPRSAAGREKPQTMQQHAAIPSFTSAFTSAGHVTSFPASATATSGPLAGSSTTPSSNGLLFASGGGGGAVRFVDMELAFTACDVTTQSLPVCGFVPSRVTKIEVQKRQHHHHRQQPSVMNSAGTTARDVPSSSLRSDTAKSGAHTENAVATTTTTTVVEAVRRVHIEPARWFTSTLHLVEFPPASKSNDSTNFASTKQHSASTTAGGAHELSFRDNTFSGSNANNLSDGTTTTTPAQQQQQRARSPSRIGGGAVAAAATSPTPKAFRDGGAGATASSFSSPSASAAAASAVTAGTPQQVAMALVKAAAELDALDSGHFSEEMLLEHWILVNAVRLPDKDFRQLACSAEQAHGISLSESFGFVGGSESDAHPFLLGGEIAKSVNHGSPVFPQMLELLKQKGQKHFFVPLDDASARNIAAAAASAVPLLMRRKVQEFISAVDVYLTSLANSGLFSGIGKTRAAARLENMAREEQRRKEEEEVAEKAAAAAMEARSKRRSSIAAGGGLALPSSAQAATTPTPVKETDPLVGGRMRSRQHARATTFKDGDEEKEEEQQQQKKGGGSGGGDHQYLKYRESSAPFKTAPPRRVCAGIPLLKCAPVRVEFVNLFLDRAVIDEVLNARKIYNSDRIEYQATLTLVPSPSLGGSAVFGGGGALAFSASAAALFSGDISNDASTSLQLPAAGSSGSLGGAGARNGRRRSSVGGGRRRGSGGNALLHDDENDLTPVNNTTSTQRHQFITDLRGLQEREALGLASASQFLSLFDVVSLTQHATEFGFFGTEVFHSVERIHVPSPAKEKVQFGGPASSGPAAGASSASAASAAGAAGTSSGAARGGARKPGGGGGAAAAVGSGSGATSAAAAAAASGTGGDTNNNNNNNNNSVSNNGPFAPLIKKNLTLLNAASVSAHSVAHFVLHLNERLHAARCAFIARRYCLLGPAAAVATHHSRSHSSLGSQFRFSCAPFKAQTSSVSSTSSAASATIGSGLLGSSMSGAAAAAAAAAGGLGMFSTHAAAGGAPPLLGATNVAGSFLAAPGERSTFTVSFGSGSTAAKIVLNVRELPLGLRAVHRNAARQLAMARKKFALAEQAAAAALAAGQKSVAAAAAAAAAAAVSGAGAGATKADLAATAALAALAAFKETMSLLDEEFQRDSAAADDASFSTSAQQQHQVQEQQSRGPHHHWAGGFVVEDIASVTILGTEAEAVKHMLDLPCKSGWSFTRDYRIPVFIENASALLAATQATKHDDSNSDIAAAASRRTAAPSSPSASPLFAVLSDASGNNNNNNNGAMKTNHNAELFTSQQVRQRIELAQSAAAAMKRKRPAAVSPAGDDSMPPFAQLARARPNEFSLHELLIAELQDRIDAVTTTQKSRLYLQTHAGEGATQQQNSRQRRVGSLSFPCDQQHQQESGDSSADYQQQTLSSTTTTTTTTTSNNNNTTLMGLISGIKTSLGVGGGGGGASAAFSKQQAAALNEATRAASVVEQLALKGVHSVVGFRWKWDMQLPKAKEEKKKKGDSSENTISSAGDGESRSGNRDKSSNNPKNGGDSSSSSSSSSDGECVEQQPLLSKAENVSLMRRSSHGDGNTNNNNSDVFSFSARSNNSDAASAAWRYDHLVNSAHLPIATSCAPLFPRDEIVQQELLENTLTRVKQVFAAPAATTASVNNNNNNVWTSMTNAADALSSSSSTALAAAGWSDPLDKSMPDSGRKSSDDGSETTAAGAAPNASGKSCASVNGSSYSNDVGITMLSFSVASALIRAKAAKQSAAPTMMMMMMDKNNSKSTEEASVTAASCVAFQYEKFWHV